MRIGFPGEKLKQHKCSRNLGKSLEERERERERERKRERERSLEDRHSREYSGEVSIKLKYV